MPRRIRRARGVTLIELIVGILLVAVALTLILPFIVKIRAQAAVHGNVNKMRRIGEGVHVYHDVYRSFPSQPKSKDD
jgi:prepilin-type N-terminal cleavage/methylation domain-containing protein